MKHWAMYDAQGVIRMLAAGNEAPEQDGLTALELEGIIDPRDWHVENGALVAGGIDTTPLDRVKRLHWLSVKAKAQAQAETDITVGGYTFNADAASRASLFEKVQIAVLAAQDGLTFSVDWELANGNAVTLNANQTKAIVRAIDVRSDAIRAKARTLRAQIVAATTKVEVMAVVWTWP